MAAQFHSICRCVNADQDLCKITGLKLTVFIYGFHSLFTPSALSVIYAFSCLSACMNHPLCSNIAMMQYPVKDSRCHYPISRNLAPFCEPFIFRSMTTRFMLSYSIVSVNPPKYVNAFRCIFITLYCLYSPILSQFMAVILKCGISTIISSLPDFLKYPDG